MKKLMSVLLAIFGIVLIAFLVFCITYFSPKEISREISGVIYQLGDGNKDYIIETTVYIEGTLNRNLFASSELTGSFKVAGDKDLEPHQHYQLHATKSKGTNSWTMYYLNNSNGSINSYMYGTMYANDKLTELTIAKLIKDTEKSASWNGGDGFMLSAPAKTRDEAVSISKRYMEDIIANISW